MVFILIVVFFIWIWNFEKCPKKIKALRFWPQPHFIKRVSFPEMSLYHFCLIELLFNYLLLAPLVQIANTQNSWADKGNQHQNQCSKKFAKVCILLPGWADYNGAFNYRKLALHLTVFTQPCKFHHRVRKRVNVTILCQIFFSRFLVHRFESPNWIGPLSSFVE